MLANPWLAIADRARLRGALAGDRRPVTIALGLTFALETALGFVPGFAGPGYETALVSGAVLPTVVAVGTAQHLKATALAPHASLARAAWIGTSVAALTLLVSLVHGLRVGICDPGPSLEVMALGPLAGVVLAALWGGLAAELARFVRAGRRRGVARVLLALGGPLGSIAVGVARFYSSPMVFGYDPFVGYFSGTLYDTVLEYDRLALYRLGSAATVLGLACCSAFLRRREDGRVGLVRRAYAGVALLGLAAAAGSVTLSLRGAALGHWSTRASIAEELGGRLAGDRCDVVYARTLREEDVRLFAKECEAHVAANEAWWGARGPEKITAFLFADEDQKGRLMGASGTNIAKPWRAEVYVQDSAFPHRVLGHELMHVIAAESGPWPFHVAGGLLPNPGLIEGVAVAASPKEDDLGPMEWAKAMRDLKILPPLGRLLGLSFFGENSPLAYTVSGAFVGWFHDRYGAEALRTWYREGSTERAVGKSLATLEAEWLEALDAIALPEAARIQAKAKFDRPGFFARRCPRYVDACRDRAESLTSAGDVVGALEALAAARAYEPDNPGLRIDEAAARAATQPAEADRLLRELADDERAPRTARDKALEELGDRALAAGDVKSARALYADLATRTFDEARLRTLDVKMAAAADEELRPAVVLLLIGKPGRKPDRAGAMALLGALDAARPDDGLPAYLMARPAVESGDWASAAAGLDRALGRRIALARVRAEALRLRIVVAAATSDLAEAERRLVALRALPEVRAARVEAAERLVDRTRWLVDRDARRE